MAGRGPVPEGIGPFLLRGHKTPYSKTADLPKPVRDALPSGAQAIFMGAFNGSIDSVDGDEGRASAIAWAAVKAKYKKDKDGKWVLKESVAADPPSRAGRVRVQCDLSKARFYEDIGTDGQPVHKVDMVLIEMGWSMNDHYYGREVLEQLESKVDGQPKMFLNHLPQGKKKHERDFRDWAGTIESHAFADGRVSATVTVHDDDLYRRAKEAPSQVGASIDVFAKVKDGEIDGRRGQIIEGIEEYVSTDFVLYPAAGGRVERVAASEGFGAVDLSVSENLAKMMADMVAKQKSWDEWWKLRSAMDDLMQMVGEDEDMDADAKATAMHGVIDQFADMAKKLDLPVMFGHMDHGYDDGTEEGSKKDKGKPKYRKMMMDNEPPPEKGGKGGSMSDIKTLAALMDAHPDLCKELEADVRAKIDKETNTSKLAEDLKAAQERIKALEANVAKANTEKDELAVKIAAAERANKVEAMLAEAKLPAFAVTKEFREELLSAKDDATAKAKIDDRKKVVEEARGSASNPNPASYHPKTGEPANGGGDTNRVKEYLDPVNVAASFNR